ncbi:MAG TPA: calcium-binding protein [Thermoleophilaceae bacterium]
MRLRGAVLASAVLAALAPAGAAASHEDAPASVVLFSEPGDYVGMGEHRVFHPGNSTMGAGWRDEGYLGISLQGGSSDDNFGLDFAAPKGQPLRPGVYDNAMRAGLQDPGRPGIDVNGDGRGCNVVLGRFEVREIDVTPEGGVRKLWIVFEHHCHGALQAMYGEVRVGMPDTVVPALVRWPESDIGRATAPTPVTVRGPAQLGAASVAGRDGALFPLRSDGCAGHSLAAGEQCQVLVDYEPAAAGTHLATLHIPGAADVPLQGHARAGSTRIVLDSEPGDPVGEGRDATFTPSNSVLTFDGTPARLIFQARQPDDDWWGNDHYWSGGFFPPDGATLTPGSYPGAAKAGSGAAGPELLVSYWLSSCESVAGEFQVHEATYTPGGVLRTLGMDFVQRCDGAGGALRGTLELRRGDRTPPAPWMEGGAPDPDAPDTGGGPGGGSGPGTGPGTGSGSGPGGSGPGSTTPGGPCLKGRSDGLAPILGTAKANRLRGTSRADVLIGLGGHDRIRAGAGADCVDAGTGNDVVSAAAGNDRVYGGRGNDRLNGGPGRDLLNCGPGRDVATVSEGDRTKSCERVVRPRKKG